MSINLHVHEALSCMFASQSQMLFDRFGWKNVVFGQNLVGQKVAGNAIHVVFYDLLLVLSQTTQVGMELFGVRCQESIHAYFAQAVRTC